MTPEKIVKWLKHHWVWTALLLLFILPTAGFLVLSVGLLIYTFFPADYSDLQIPPLHHDTQHLAVLAHGVGDTPASWSAPLAQMMAQQWAPQGNDQQAIALDWHQYSNSSLRCAVNGRRIGQWLGAQLSQSQGLESVHLIGHSCGAFVVYGVCEALREKRPQTSVQTTYLDPVSIYTGLSWDFGIERFGDCADFSDAYIDHEDGVPGSNELLPHAHTFDVTAARHTLNTPYAPHVWPTHYYQRLVESGNHPSLKRSPELTQKLPAGILEKISTLP